MYKTFYGLRENPFNATPDPQFIFLSENHREALAQLVYGVQEKKGFIVLTGEVGTGKTTLIHYLLDKLDHGNTQTRTAFLFNPKLSVHDFIEYILKDLGVPVQGGTKGDHLHLLHENLLQAYKNGEQVILIIDEAQGLNPALLEEIRLLSNLETAKSKLLQIILVGQPELNKVMLQTGFRQLRQRVNMRYHLPPLTKKETKEYIERRLRIAGGRETIFTRRAIRAVYQQSKGIPRTINILCDNAMLNGYATEQKTIDKKIIVETARDLKIQRPSFPIRSVYLLIGFVGIGILTFVLLQRSGALRGFFQKMNETFQYSKTLMEPVFRFVETLFL